MRSILGRFAGMDPGKKIIILVACCEGLVMLIAFIIGLLFYLRT